MIQHMRITMHYRRIVIGEKCTSKRAALERRRHARLPGKTMIRDYLKSHTTFNCLSLS